MPKGRGGNNFYHQKMEIALCIGFDSICLISKGCKIGLGQVMLLPIVSVSDIPIFFHQFFLMCVLLSLLS